MRCPNQRRRRLATLTKRLTIERLETRELLSSIGTFQDGTWRIDSNRNHSWDGTSGGDVQLLFGQSGDRPVTGDWTGIGHDQIGVYRSGSWLLDVNDNGVSDGTRKGGVQFKFGGAKSNVLPVVGDWNGD